MIFWNFGFPWPGRGHHKNVRPPQKYPKKSLVKIHTLNFSELKKLLESIQGARRTIRLKIIEFSWKSTLFLNFCKKNVTTWLRSVSCYTHKTWRSVDWRKRNLRSETVLYVTSINMRRELRFGITTLITFDYELF